MISFTTLKLNILDDKYDNNRYLDDISHISYLTLVCPKCGSVGLYHNHATYDRYLFNNSEEIYHGTLSNWNEVGGNNQKIVAFQRPERSESQVMMTYFMGETSLKEPLTYEVISAMGGIAEYHNEKGAIGYTFKYFLEGLNQEEHVKILSIDGVYPTNENIKNQTYPASTYLYYVTLKSNHKENEQKLKDYLLSEQGQDIIEKTGYCALS